ncbi:hypothetical protein GALMADRAFT_228004 [Galerina marginata CBS 339.88]|uniref:Srp40 C-terminal domain-containing protein n=1 Tax=Galerina marginata (strain CBS 339.88) TaxID=685588 RepID=A0A067SRJ5_GALM3|nr:hypothetical protein GALMADRAFT_228004 [Galerina marginata CBS 339.88]
MDGNLATTYTLIHAFLLKNSHTKAAQAVKKAAKEVVVLKDDIELEGPQLDEIIKDWKAASQKKEQSSSDSDSDSSSSSGSSSFSNKNAKTKNKKGKSSKSSSSSSSSSDDSDSGSDSTPDKSVRKDAKVKSPAAKAPSPSNSSSSSGSDSDDESSDSESSKTKKKKLVKKKAVNMSENDGGKVLAPERDSSRTLSTGDASSSKPESDSDSDSSSNSGTTKTVSRKKAAASKKESCDSSRGSSRSGDESDTKKIATKPATKKGTKQSSPSSSGSSSSSHSDADSDSDSKMAEVNKPSVPAPKTNDEVKPTKKRRTDIDGTAVITATTASVQEMQTGPQSTGRIKGGNGKGGRPANERFQRVDPTKYEPIANNQYLAKHAPDNDYGKRAHEDLIVTRGAGFRKEKNKKKKGSYRGGEITMQSHSFKFT